MKICKICESFWQNQQHFQQILNEKIEIRERCKGVHCVDLGESFQIDPNSNEYLLAKIGVDTAENELLHVLFIIIQYNNYIIQSCP